MDVQLHETIMSIWTKISHGFHDRIHNNTVLDAVQVILKCLIDFIKVSLFGSNKTFIVALVCHIVFVYLSFMQ